MKVGFWQISEEELREILAEYNLTLEQFNIEGFTELMNSPFIGYDDSWRKHGRDYFVRETIESLISGNVETIEKQAVSLKKIAEYIQCVQEWCESNLDELLRTRYCIDTLTFNYDAFNAELAQSISKRHNSLKTVNLNPQDEVVIVLNQMFGNGTWMKTHTPPTADEQQVIEFKKRALYYPFNLLLEHLAKLKISLDDFNLGDFLPKFNGKAFPNPERVALIINEVIEQLREDGALTIQQLEGKNKLYETWEALLLGLSDDATPIAFYNNGYDFYDRLDELFELGFSENKAERYRQAQEMGYLEYSEDNNNIPTLGPNYFLENRTDVAYPERMKEIQEMKRSALEIELYYRDFTESDIDLNLLNDYIKKHLCEGSVTNIISKAFEDMMRDEMATHILGNMTH